MFFVNCIFFSDDFKSLCSGGGGFSPDPNFPTGIFSEHFIYMNFQIFALKVNIAKLFCSKAQLYPNHKPPLFILENQSVDV